MLEIENITYDYVTYLDNNLNIDIKDFSLVRDYVIKELLIITLKFIKRCLFY